MNVIWIMMLALVGTVAMLALCGCARWSFIYLIRYRLLKMEVHQKRYTLSARNDVLSVTIAFIALAVVVALIIYGVPFVIEHISEIPMPELPL